MTTFWKDFGKIISISDVHCQGGKTAPDHRSCPSSCCSAARRFQCRNLTLEEHYWCHLCSAILFEKACNLFCAFNMHWQQHLQRGELKHFEWQRFFQSWGIDGQKAIINVFPFNDMYKVPNLEINCSPWSSSPTAGRKSNSSSAFSSSECWNILHLS